MQYGKVEICGVNTSQLKLLKESEKRELLFKIKNGTESERKAAREKMINGNLRLVLSVIQRFTNRGENPDDLFQVGVIGLIKAIDNFDPSLDVRFSTYGVPMIYEQPDDFKSVLIDVDDPDGPFGAKSISEIACNGAAPAIGIAIHDAVGVWLEDWPMTPEKILRKLGKIV